MSIGTRYESLMLTACEIKEYIQSFGTDNVQEKSGRRWGDFHELEGSLYPYYNQTYQGLTLVESCGTPDSIHTPLGQLKILSCSSGDWEKVMEICKDSLGLKQLYPKASAYEGPIWAIKTWKGESLEDPMYCIEERYISYDRAQAIWNRFLFENELGPYSISKL